MSDYKSPFRIGDQPMNEEQARIDQLLIELVAKVGELTGAFPAFKADITKIIDVSHAHCRQDMRRVDDGMSETRAWQRAHEAAHKATDTVKSSVAHTTHHWQHMVILVLGIVMGILGIKVLH